MIKEMIVSPKKFYEYMCDIHFLATGFGEGYFMGIHVLCPDWTETYALFRIEESIQKLNELLKPNRAWCLWRKVYKYVHSI